MDSIKNIFTKIKWDSILISLFTITIGILCTVLPSQSADALCIVFGILLITMGITIGVRYFVCDRLFGTHLLILSIIMLVSGIFCLVYPDTIQGILTLLFGIYIVIDSLQALSDSIYCAKSHTRGWLVLFILSLCTTILGIAVMFSTFESVMIFAGISLIIEGTRNFVMTLVFSHKIKEAKKQIATTIYM